MGLFDSLLFYLSSLVMVWCGYAASIWVFAYYNKRILAAKDGLASMLSNRKLILYRILCLLPVALTAAIRGYATGADTHGVWLEYIRCLEVSLVERLSYNPTAALYEVVQWVVCLLTNANVPVFFFVLAVATMYLVIVGIEKWKLKCGWLGLFIFYCCFGPQLMNQARQMLAVAILFYAYQHVYNRNFKKYVIFTVIAGLIHITAIPVGLAICFLHLKYWTKQKPYVYFVFLALVCVMIPVIISLMGVVLRGTKYYYYVDTANFEPIGFGLILSLIPTVLPALLLQKDMDKDNRMRNTICMTLPARLTAYYAYFVYRVFYFFGIVNTLAFPIAIETAPTKRRKMVYIAIIVGASLGYFLVFYGWLNASVYFPYMTFVESGIYSFGV